ncbi:MAG: hypothetical protein ACR2HN_11705 [Tepidiformaceae bacterium]
MDRKPLTRDHVLAWRAGFEAAHQADLDCLRRSTPDDNFRTLALLMASARQFGWKKTAAEEIDDGRVRERWRTAKTRLSRRTGPGERSNGG